VPNVSGSLSLVPHLQFTCSMTGRLPYVRECQLLRAASELLRLPQPVIATGLTFLHRYYRACPDAAVDQQVCCSSRCAHGGL